MAMASIAAGAVNAASCAPFAGVSKLRKSRIHLCPGAVLVQCSSEKSQPPSGSSCAAESGGSFKLSAVVVPMLAAALVGSFQPAVRASEWERNVVPVDSETFSPYSNDDAYKDLVQRMKERRARRGGGTAPTPAPPTPAPPTDDDEPEDEKSGPGFSGFPSPFQFAPPPLYSSPAEKTQEKSKPSEVKPSPEVSKPFSSPSQSTPPSFFSSPAEETDEKSGPSEEKPSQGFFNPFASFFSSPSEKIEEKIEQKSEPSEETPSPGFSNPFSSFPSFFSAPPFFSTPEQEKTPAVVEPPVAKQAIVVPPVAKEIPAEVPENAADIFDNVEPAEKQKTHGFMPLFLSQLLLLITFVGGGFVLITTPQSKWDDLQKTVDGYVEKATPLAEEAWVKAQPIAVQAQQKVGEFAVKAKPFVEKAWEASKPLAAKAVEASKPILKGAQAKALELLQQARSK